MKILKPATRNTRRFSGSCYFLELLEELEAALDASDPSPGLFVAPALVGAIS